VDEHGRARNSAPFFAGAMARAAFGYHVRALRFAASP